MPRDDESRPLLRWSEPPPGDPHRDVTGALHDVSNALTVVLGWVAEARTSSSPEQTQRALAIVEERARSARNLARRAIGAEALIDDMEESLDLVLADLVEALSVEAQRARVTLVVTRGWPGTRLPAAGDASQVLTNVVLNAIAWTPAEGRVVIEPDVDAHGIAIAIQDEGPGVEPTQARQIFEGATTREGGAGVGLKHARAVARAAGGELDLVAQAPSSHGARFRLRWPSAEPAIARAPLSSPGPAVLAGARILIVEDDQDVATLLEGALGARGAQVVIARTSVELAERARETHDAALVDLSPIAHDVLGAVDALRTGSPNVALVFISGSAVGLPEGLQAQRIWWIRKPFEVSEIVAALLESRAASGSLVGARKPG